MSILHPETMRECKRCGHRWYAEKYGRLDKQQPVMGFGFTARAQDLHRQTVHERRLQKYDVYASCSKCGSKKIRSLSPSQVKNLKRQDQLAQIERQRQAELKRRTPAVSPQRSSHSEQPQATRAPAGWHADPSGRFEVRYFDGVRWTEHVANHGRQFVDPAR